MTTNRQFTFRYTLLPHGWAEATVSDDISCVPLHASYITDALGDLARTVVDLCRSPDVPRSCSWLVEPGEYRWMFIREGHEVKIAISLFPDWSPGLGDDKGKLIFYAATSVRRLATEICGQLKQVLHDHGTAGYEASWNREFPSDELAALVGEIDKMKATSRGTA